MSWLHEVAISKGGVRSGWHGSVKFPGWFVSGFLKRREVAQIAYVSIFHYGNASGVAVTAWDVQNDVVALDLVG
jgi:hypothetical protein